MGEWRRIFNPKMILLILGAIIVNVLLFGYGQISGLTFKEFTFANSVDSYLIERYHDMSSDIALDSLKKDNTAIIGYNRQIKDDNPQTYNESGGGYDRNAEIQNIENPEIVNYFSSLTDKEKTQMLLEMKYTNVKLTYISGYHNSIAAIQGNADKLKHFTLFSKPDSFSYNNILKTASDFQRVKDISLTLVNDKAVEKFTEYYYLFYIAFALIFILIYNLFSERENGMWSMIHSAQNGRGIMAIKRLFLIMASSFIVTGALFVTTIITSLFLYGGWSDLNSPIQTIESFAKFTFVMNKLQYLLTYFLISWLVIFVLAVILWMLFIVFRNRNHTLIIVGLFLGVEVLLFNKITIQSVFSYLKYINIVNLFQINKIFSTYNNWGFGTHIFNVFLLILSTLILLLIISSITAITKTILMRPETRLTLLGRLSPFLHKRYQKIFIHFPIAFKEFHKLIITGKGLWVVGVVLLISIYFSSTGAMNFTDRQKEYDSMYLEHGGKDYSFITGYIDSEERFYKEAVAQYDAVNEQYHNGEVDLKTLADTTSSLSFAQIRLVNIDEYKVKVNYLQNLKEKQNIEGYIISDRGYEQIFGDYCKQRELILLLALTAGIMLIISECISMEYRTGMEDIVRSCERGRSWIFSRKVTACLVFTVVLFILVYGIDFYNLNRLYGFPYLNAPVQSLTFMNSCMLKVSILGWLGIRVALRFICCLITMTVAIIVSRILGKRGNRSLTILVLVVLFLIIITIFGVGGRW